MQAVTLGQDHVLFLSEFVVGVFNQLSIKDLEKAALVCKRWHEIASEHFIWNPHGLHQAMPFMKIFWTKDWEQCGGGACADLRPIKRLAANRQLEQIVVLKEDGQCICGVVPKGLTLRKIQEIATKHGIDVGFKMHPDNPEGFFDMPNPSSFIVVLTGYSLGDINRMNSAQKEWLKLFENISILPAAGFAVLTAIFHKIFIYQDQPLICGEMVHNSPLSIRYIQHSSNFIIDNFSSQMGFGGVGAQIILK